MKCEFFSKLLLQSSTLSSIISKPALKLLALKMKEMTLKPGELVFKKGEEDENIKLYFLHRG